MKGRAPAWVLVLLVLTACSAEPAPDASAGASAPSPSKTPASQENGSAPPTPAAQPSGTPVSVVKGGPPGPVAVDGDMVAFPFADDADSWNAVRTSRGGAERTVATSEWDGGLINWVALNGDGWLAYVDQDHTQGDGDPDVFWRVWAIDLATDERVLLASNEETADPYVPVVRGGGGWFFWSQAEEDRTARELAWQPGSDEPRAVLTHAELTPGSETWSDGSIVYLGPNGRGLEGHTTGGDCWRVPIDGGQEPEALTHTALAMGCAASDDTLVWTQHLPADDPRNDDIGEQPFMTWTLDLAGADPAPTRVFEGVQSGAFPIAGDGFAAWDDASRRIIVRSTASGEKVRLPRGIGKAASGTQLVVTQQAGGSWTVTRYDAP